MFKGGFGVRIDGTCACSKSGGGGGSGGTLTTLDLPDDSTTRVDIPTTDQQGSYLIVVKSTLTDGATASFSVSSARDGIAGSVVRLSSSPGVGGEEIQLDWQANNVPQLYHSVLRAAPVPELVEYQVNIRSWM